MQNGQPEEADMQLNCQ